MSLSSSPPTRTSPRTSAVRTNQVVKAARRRHGKDVGIRLTKKNATVSNTEGCPESKKGTHLSGEIVTSVLDRDINECDLIATTVSVNVKSTTVLDRTRGRRGRRVCAPGLILRLSHHSQCMTRGNSNELPEHKRKDSECV